MWKSKCISPVYQGKWASRMDQAHLGQSPMADWALTHMTNKRNQRTYWIVCISPYVTHQDTRTSFLLQNSAGWIICMLEKYKLPFHFPSPSAFLGCQTIICQNSFIQHLAQKQKPAVADTSATGSRDQCILACFIMFTASYNTPDNTSKIIIVIFLKSVHVDWSWCLLSIWRVQII